jgi:hypothetical protein
MQTDLYSKLHKIDKLYSFEMCIIHHTKKNPEHLMLGMETKKTFAPHIG